MMEEEIYGLLKFQESLLLICKENYKIQRQKHLIIKI